MNLDQEQSTTLFSLYMYGHMALYSACQDCVPQDNAILLIKLSKVIVTPISSIHLMEMFYSVQGFKNYLIPLILSIFHFCDRE